MEETIRHCPECGTTLEKEAIFCQECGHRIEIIENYIGEKEDEKKSFFKTVPGIIVILFVICCVGSILIFGTLSILTPDIYQNEVYVGGETFYLPEEYTLKYFNTTSQEKYYEYSNGTHYIFLEYFPEWTLTEYLSYAKSQTVFTNFEENVTYGNHTGFTAFFTPYFGIPCNMFVFEKNRGVYTIQIDENLNFDDNISKILG
ncbi:MAG: zinc-ribbon domain-containing protein [Methanobacteriaceae archaeon]|jgi:hypothetical protein|nr:zinc-ribbon domain-containing protein [Candidatus Methanorudis spinitermitis]